MRIVAVTSKKPVSVDLQVNARFIVEEGVGEDARFWRLADSLWKLYPSNATEKRWVDGVLARKNRLGF